MHYCYAPLLHNPQPRPGSYVQSPAWQIGTSYTPPSGLPRRRRGSRAGRSNVSGKGQSREATPSMPFTTTISYVGPRCYRPGRGPGRELPPRRREPCWPFHRVPAPASGACRGERPGRAWPGGRSIYCSPFSPTPPALRAPPPPPGGGSAGDIPGKAGPGCRPQLCPSPALSHAPDRGDIIWGGAGEGTPSPSKRTILALPQGSRAGSGAIVVMAREGRSRGAGPNVRFAGPYTALPSPPPRPRFALLPRPMGGRSAGDIPR